MIIEAFLIAQVNFVYLTPENRKKVIDKIKSNRNSTEQTVVNILKKAPTVCDGDNIFKFCTWREKDRKLSVTWKNGKVYLWDFNF